MSKMKRLAVTVLALLIVFAVFGKTSVGYADESGDFRKQAKDLLIDGEYQDSYDLLMKNYAANKDDVETNFLLGQVTMALDRPEDAIGYYKAALARDPSLQRVRLELARAYASNRQTELAKQELNAVLATNPPKPVGDNIQKFLVALDAQKDWSARVSVGYIFDSNSNVGPTSDTVHLGLSPSTSFLLSPNSQPREDHGITASMNLGYVHPFTRKFALQTEAQYSRVTYFKSNRFDPDVISLSAGPSFKDSTYAFSVPLLFNYIWIESSPYNWAYGIAPQLQVSLTQKLLATVSVTGQVKGYYKNLDRAGTVWSFNTGLKYFPTTKAYLQAGYSHTEENTQKVYLDNGTDAVNLGAYVLLPAGFSAFAQEQVAFNGYKARQAIFPHERDDVQYLTNVNVAKALGKSGFAVGVGYTYTRNDSTLDLFDYSRHQVTAQLTKSF